MGEERPRGPGRRRQPTAPICTSCHSPHAMIKGAAASMDTVPCKACHGTIFTAYAASVHGVLRNGGLAAAPLCFNCHGAHDVAVPRRVWVARRLSGLPYGGARSHRTWLPNVDLHFNVVSCPVCHAPNAQRMVDLILYNSTTQAREPGPVGMPEFESLSGSRDRGSGRPGSVDAFGSAQGAESRRGVEGKTSIRGRLEVSTGVEDHELTFASKAISDVQYLPSAGRAAFQSVMVSVAGPAGIPIRYAANKDVLNSAFSLELGRRLLCHRRHQDHVSGCAFCSRSARRYRRSAAHLTRRWAFQRYSEPTRPTSNRKS